MFNVPFYKFQNSERLVISFKVFLSLYKSNFEIRCVICDVVELRNADKTGVK